MSKELEIALPSYEQLQPPTPSTRRPPLVIVGLLAIIGAVIHQLAHSALLRSARFSPDLHPYTHASDAELDWSWLSYTKMCPALSLIGNDEYTARRDQLAELLRGEHGNSWGAYVSEPRFAFFSLASLASLTFTSSPRPGSANGLHYVNLTQSDWYLSERPWLVVITPSSSSNSSSHLSILTPAFELSRSQRLPFALTPSEFASVSWVTWQEADDPYAVLLQHLERLRAEDAVEGDWSIEVEENVRQFIAAGLAGAAQQLKKTPTVRLARLAVREQRMRKTEAELAIQRCITLEALRAVRKHLRIGMTEKEGEALITNALHAGGLTDIGVITLFGDNAALPHASASATRRLEKGEFALFDVDGSLFGYQSDFTRTMLPDPPSSRCHGSRSLSPEWPSARAKKIWTTVHLAQETALAKLVTGNSSQPVHAAEVDEAARSVIASEGWGQYFTHRLGHGIGLEVHEQPYLNAGNVNQVLQSGETFSNEPGIYIERAVDPKGVGIGVRLEDMVHKTETGWELLSGSGLARSPWDP
ncbi:hypothetical protein JCM1841_002533 [Sporobolomyces salmonicolor]